MFFSAVDEEPYWQTKTWSQNTFDNFRDALYVTKGNVMQFRRDLSCLYKDIQRYTQSVVVRWFRKWRSYVLAPTDPPVMSEADTLLRKCKSWPVDAKGAEEANIGPDS